MILLRRVSFRPNRLNDRFAKLPSKVENGQYPDEFTSVKGEEGLGQTVPNHAERNEGCVHEWRGCEDQANEKRASSKKFAEGIKSFSLTDSSSRPIAQRVARKLSNASPQRSY